MSSLPTITIVRGTDFSFDLEFRQPDGTPLSISGARVYFTAKRKVDDDDTDAEAVFRADLLDHLDAEGGKTQVSGRPQDTVSKKPGEYEYDVELVDSAGRVTSFGRGKFVLEGELTRRA